MFIGKNYKVEADDLNVTVYKRYISKKTRKEYWRGESYFSSIKNALDYLVELEVKLTQLKDLATVVKKQDELHDLIKSLTLS